MKARRIPTTALEACSEDVMRREIVRIRLAEVLACAPALDHGDAKELHDLRIACKRLRYALELHRDALPPECAAAEHVLAELQDLLGELHDCDVLTSLAKKRERGVVRTIERDRRALLDLARRRWREALQPTGALSALAAFAGFGSPQGSTGGAP